MSGSENLFRLYAEGIHWFDANGYPKAWHQIKHLVREQADHRCVRCGHPYLGKYAAKKSGLSPSNPEWSPCDEGCTHPGPIRHRPPSVPFWLEDEAYTAQEAVRGGLVVEAKWRVLTVHHLDGDKANCRWWNLVALCQRCHLTIQGKVKMGRRWDKPHTAWFQPYVAGYYAWGYLRKDLTREETLARIDELLALEHFQQQLPTQGGL